MLAILQDHLSLTETPEMINLYERAIDLFEKYDLEDYEMGYDDILMSADGAVDGISISGNDALHGLTVRYADLILTEHQIVLSNEATLLHRILVLEFIRQIEYTELVSECFETLSSEDWDNLDKFGKCMEIVSGVVEEDSMLFLEQVPDCVIKTMQEYFGRRVELEVATETLDQSVKDVFREMDKYVRIIKGQEMRSAKYLFDEEGCVGLPFEHHFNQNKDYLLKLPLQAMIYECIGFALLSEDGLANPEKIILASVGAYIGDLDRLTVIQYEISKILIDYRNEVSSGVGLVI